jgi:hypothetical protein
MHGCADVLACDQLTRRDVCRRPSKVQRCCCGELTQIAGNLLLLNEHVVYIKLYAAIATSNGALKR